MERFDIAVFGAGPAGICAAIQAARGGARTLLVEKNGCVGGAISSAGVAVPGLFDAWGRQVISGVGWELVRKTLEANGDPLPDFSRRMTGDFWRGQIPVNSFLFVAIAEEELVRAGVTVRYHTMPGAAEFRDGACRWSQDAGNPQGQGRPGHRGGHRLRQHGRSAQSRAVDLHAGQVAAVPRRDRSDQGQRLPAGREEYFSPGDRNDSGRLPVQPGDPRELSGRRRARRRRN